MNDSAKQGRPSTGRRGKIVFLLVALGAGAVVYFVVQRETLRFNWPTDLPAALQQGREDNRRILVFFTAPSKSRTARDVINVTLYHSRGEIDQAGVVKVNVELNESLTSETARRYRITRLPTFLLLSPQGWELNRREGMVGVTEFQEGFLKCTKVIRPKARP